MRSFNCERCGECCKNIPKHVALPKKSDGSCGHLQEDNSCGIYESRPDYCSVEKVYDVLFSKAMHWDEYNKKTRQACRKAQKHVGWKGEKILEEWEKNDKESIT